MMLYLCLGGPLHGKLMNIKAGTGFFHTGTAGKKYNYIFKEWFYHHRLVKVALSKDAHYPDEPDYHTVNNILDSLAVEVETYFNNEEHGFLVNTVSLLNIDIEKLRELEQAYLDQSLTEYGYILHIQFMTVKNGIETILTCRQPINN